MPHHVSRSATVMFSLLGLLGCEPALPTPEGHATDTLTDSARTAAPVRLASASYAAETASQALKEPARTANVAQPTAGSIALPPLPAATPATLQLGCAQGAPGELPQDLELIAMDVTEHLWTANAGIVSWFATNQAMTPTLFRRSLAGSDAGVAMAAADPQPNVIVQSDTLAADGGEVFVREQQLTGAGERAVLLTRLRQGDDPVHVARQPGTSLGRLALDEAALYWLRLDGEQLSVERTERAARAAQDTRPLGMQTLAGFLDAASQSRAAGPIVLGERVYATLSWRGQGRVLRVGKDGREPLSELGSRLPAISALTSDGEALILALEPEFDELGNQHNPARIVRLTLDGELRELAQGAAVSVAVSGGRVYWNSNRYAPEWRGDLWSAPLAGSDGARLELSTRGNLLSQELAPDPDGVVFALYCRVDLSAQEVTGRTHLLRLTR